MEEGFGSLRSSISHWLTSREMKPSILSRVSHIDQSLIRLVPELHEDMIWPEPVTGRE